MASKFLVHLTCLIVIILSLSGCKTKAEKEAQRALTSAEQGAAIAQFKLGKMYATGEGVPQDMLYAYMWVNFADIQGLGASAKKYKNELTSKMTADQIAAAEKLTAECREKSYKDC